MNRIRPHALLPLVLLFFSFPGGAPAGENAEILFSKGTASFLKGDYTAAVLEFREASEAAPEDGSIRLHLAMVLNRTQNYEEAREILEGLLKKTPESPEALSEMGTSYLGLMEFDKAVDTLRLACRLAPENAQAHYLLALAYYNLKKWRTSIRYYRLASKLDPTLAAECHYSAGVSYLHLAHYIQARNEFQKAIRVAPDGDKARPSEEYIVLIDKLIRRGKHVSATITTGYEYDTNVMLLPDDKEIYGISQQDDFRFFTSVDAAIRPWTVGLLDPSIRYSFYQSVHNHIGDYNMQGHTLTPTFFLKTRPVEPFVAYQYSYFFLDDNKLSFLRSHAIQAGFNIYESARFMTTLNYQLLMEDYLTHFPNEDDNPDGNNHTVGFSQYLPLPIIKDSYLTLGMYCDRNNSRGKNYIYNGYKFRATMSTPLFARLRFDGSAEFYARDFPHHTLGRQDARQTYAWRISRPLNKFLEVGTQYLLMVNRSQEKAYRFNRSVFTVDLTARF